MLLTGSQILVEVLCEQGVDTIFGYPGGHVLQIYNALGKNQDRIKHILTSHEQGATHSADGYARSSGKVGVGLVTTGPGATNSITGLATAMADSVPMVVITGSCHRNLAGTDSFQEIDVLSLTVAVTKHSFLVSSVEELADTVREAFQIAKSGRPGPVMIDIPQDVQMDLCIFKKAEEAEKEEIPKANEYDFERAVELIKTSIKPIIYCGGGVINGDCAKEVIELSEKIDSYISCTMMGLSAVDGHNERNLGMSGVYGKQISTVAVSEADLIIAVGCRFSDRSTGDKEKFGAKAKIIHLDIDEAESGKIIRANESIIGELKNSLQVLIEKVEQKKNTQWHKEIEKIKEVFEEKSQADNFFRPKEIIEKINSIIPSDTVIATDVGQHQMWVSKYYKFSKPRTHLSSGGFGTMGYGMGATIGASIATKKRCLLFTGDGSFHMNMNEIATAVRYNLPVTVVVLNNGSLGMITQLQTFFCDRDIFSTDLNYKTDFSKVAKAMGADGYTVVTMGELEKAIGKTEKAEGPVIIDCIISKENMATPMMASNGNAYNMLE